jgi:uncharacterized membrane protein YbaN (DUF454 family)
VKNVLNIKQSLFVILGSFFLVIGIIGIFIPVLPTTPFLLLSSFFYVRSSKRLYNWLLANKILSAYIGDYIGGRGIPLKVKLYTITLLWTVIVVTVVFAVEELIFRTILVLVAVGVSVHIALIKGYKKTEIGLGSDKG